VRRLTRYLSKVGVAAPELEIWPKTTSPAFVAHIRPTAEPSITGAKGDIYFDSTANCLMQHNGSAWEQVGASPSGNVAIGGTLDVTGAAVLGSTLAVTGATTLTGAVNYKRQVTDTGGVYATPIALTEAQSGRVILVDDAAGLDFTLPAVAAAQIGTFYEFLVSVTITSNLFRVTAQTGDLLRGAVSIVDFDTANTISYFAADESNDLIFSCNGDTKGGKKGTRVRFTAITATGWFVDGLLYGDGVLATPFA
jgi:hypothetical protein